MGNSNPYGFSSKSTAEDVTTGVDLTNKVAIVTGANTGIGKETARVLALRGAKVIVACRDANRGQDAATEIAQTAGVSQDMVEGFAAAFLAKDLPLHLLILNAGVMAPAWGLTQEGFEMMFGVNHIGHFLLTSLLIEKVKSSGSARIIVVSSEGHKMGNAGVLDLVREEKDYSPWIGYGQSKLANVLFALELARRLQGTDVSVCSLHPGAIHTDLGRYSTAASIFYVLGSFWMKSIPQGAATTCFAATHPSIPANSGKYYADSMIAKTSPYGQDQQLASQLWTLSEQLTNTTFLAPPANDAQ